MVQNNGAPAQRGPPVTINGRAHPINVYDDDRTGGSLHRLQRHLEQGTLPPSNTWLRNCVLGLSQPVEMADLKAVIASGIRLDMEGAVALVLAMLGRETAASLVPHLHRMVDSRACLWLDRDVVAASQGQFPLGSQLRAAHRIRAKMAAWTLLQRTAPGPSPAAFLQALRAIRRSSKHPQALEIPAWVCAYAKDSAEHCRGEENPRVVCVSKKAFRVLQRWLRDDLGSDDRRATLRKQIAALAAVGKGRIGVSPDGQVFSEHVEALMATEDPYALGYSFLAIQRRLQLRIVSDIGWTVFLKGESCSQNDHQTPTTLDMALVELSLGGPNPDYTALGALRIPPGLPASCMRSCRETRLEEILSRVCMACGFMRDYVDLYGNGHWRNLVLHRVRYLKPGEARPGCRFSRSYGTEADLYEDAPDRLNYYLHGIRYLRPGEGDAICIDCFFCDCCRGLVACKRHRPNRGPVDQYNAACDALLAFSQEYASLVKRTLTDLRRHGILPEAPRKFLAVDIMARNFAWADDAFADGLEPPWSIWLREHEKD
jgi:hypothetical protein